VLTREQVCLNKMRDAAYLKLHRTGELRRRAHALLKALSRCELCPRRCRVNRSADERGFCRTGRHAVVSSYGPHFGEEDPLVGRGGSGTLFFTHCNLRCCFCQNYEISHQGVGREVRKEELAVRMVSLQERGCCNVNFVSPSHVVAQIVEALPLAVDAGLRVPLVYNTGGYDAPETLRLLEGVFDIYMPDYKFTRADVAEELAGAEDYPVRVRQALVEMHRQVGDLSVDEEGLATRGLLIRHLVLPHGLAGSEEAFRWVACRISRNTYLNVMDQYRPCHNASSNNLISRRTTQDEMHAAFRAARKQGLTRLDKRRLPSRFFR
jgi:putative pyruvate formate lyase activating enzyme